MRRWYEGFVKRHPELGHRRSGIVKKVRIDAQEAEENIAYFFNEYLAKYRHLPPSQVYAADETGLDGDGSRVLRVLAPKGMKRPSNQQDSYREHTSLLHIANAAGTTLPMIVMFKGKDKVDAEAVAQLAELAPDALWGTQESGYFIGEQFMQVLQHFEKHATTQRPLLFIMDGAKGHVEEQAAQWAIARDIHILLLPSNLTHLLQVADVSLFRPFKQYWKNGCRQLKSERTRMGQVSDRSIRKTDIIPLVVQAWAMAMTAKNVEAGFKRTGIYPFDPNAYKQSESKHLQSLTGLPLLLTPTKEILTHSHTVPSIASSLPLVVPAGKEPPCTECGRSGKKKVVRPTVSTKKGLLLTGASGMAAFEARREFDRAAAEAKTMREEDRERKRQAKAEDNERKTKRREERERLKAEKEASTDEGKKEKKTSRKRKAIQLATETDVEVGGVEEEKKEKENVNFNIPSPHPIPNGLVLHPSMIISVCPDHPPPIPLSSPTPPPTSVLTHSHGTRHALRFMR
jgi:hypothetical protein